MFYICILTTKAINTFCLASSEDTSITSLMSWGQFSVELKNNQLVLQGVQSILRDNQHINYPINALEPANYWVNTTSSSFAMLVRPVKVEELIMKRYFLQREITIGRSRTNSIIYLDGNTSVKHGWFHLDGNGKLHYCDNSTNGTWINGKRICHCEQVLQDGDIIVFPPMLRIIISNGFLFINHPANVRISQELIPCSINEQGRIPITLCSLSTGSITPAFLPRIPHSLSEFCTEISKQLSSEICTLIQWPSAIWDAETKKNLVDIKDVVRCLTDGKHMFLIA